jgi:toxin HigB-1
MIRSFRSKALSRYYASGETAKLSVQDPARIRRILIAINDAKMPDDMNLPGMRFHGLKGQDRGRFVVDVSGNWRITFGWDGMDAIDVDLEDYH